MQSTDAVEEGNLPKALSQAISVAFDLSKGPLIHATLIPLMNQQEHVLVVNMHYAVADGWSLGVLFKDISRAYNGLKHGKGDALGRVSRYVVLEGAAWYHHMSAYLTM